MLFARHVVVQRSCVHAMQDPLTSCTAATSWVCRQKARRGMRWCFDHVHANVMLFMCCVSAGAPSRGAYFPKMVALRLRTSLETSGRALTQKRKNAGASWKKGVRFLSPGRVCRASAGHFLGPFSGPPFFVCVVQGSTNVAFDCRIWSGGRSSVLQTPRRTWHKCSFTASPPPTASTPPKMLFHSLAGPRKNALSQPPRPQKCLLTASIQRAAGRKGQHFALLNGYEKAHEYLNVLWGTPLPVYPFG